MVRETINIKDFYSSFNHSGQNHFESLSKIKCRQKVTLSMYKKIILKFLTIYFYDVYFLKRPVYFFLGGLVKLNKCGNWIRRDRSKGSDKIALKKIGQTLGVFWYNKPCWRFEYALKIKKITGSTSRIAEIEKEWKKSNDIDSLFTVRQLKENGHQIVSKN